MDFTCLDVRAAADSGAEIRPRNPFTLKPLDDVVFYVLGADSARVSSVVQEMARARLEGKISKEDAILKIAASTVTGWKGVEFKDDTGELKEYPYTPENALALLSNPAYLWLLNEVSDFVQSRRNFMPKPADG